MKNGHSSKKISKRFHLFLDAFLETYFHFVKVSASKQKKWLCPLATVTDAPKNIF